MDKKPPASVKLWMPIFIKDHRAKASTLTHTEHSALTYFSMLLWEHDGVIMDDDKWIAKHVRLNTRQWKAIRASVLQDCVVSKGKIENPELMKELKKAKVNVEQKRKAGLASAAARKSNGCSTAVATAVQPRAGGGEGEGPIQREVVNNSSKGTVFKVHTGGQS